MILFEIVITSLCFRTLLLDIVDSGLDVSYSSDQTRQRILSHAEKEFLEHGFLDANLRRIAKSSKATTGALYNHFSNKADLFDALVQEPADEMLRIFEELHEETLDGVSRDSYDGLSNSAESGTDWMLAYIYEHANAFKLVFCCSEGTRWSLYFDRLVEIEEKAHRKYFEALSSDGAVINDFFLHITSAATFQYFVEFLSHDLPYENAVAVMSDVKRYGMAGWSAVLGVEL